MHKNSLRKRLDELVTSGIVIKHLYQIPKNDLYYGNTSQYTSLPDCRYHYLLNVFKQETKELLTLHYFLDKIDFAIEEINAMKKETTDEKERDNLNMQWRTLAIARIRNAIPRTEYEKLKERLLRNMAEIEATESPIERYILEEKRGREYELDQVRFHHHARSYYDIYNKNRREIFLHDTFKDNLVEFADHLVRFKVPIFDLIIRCCNAVIISTEEINPNDKYSRYLLFPMVSYREMLFLVRCTKHGKDMLQKFGVSLEH